MLLADGVLLFTCVPSACGLFASWLLFAFLLGFRLFG
jgi:hypothetical protein